MWRMGGGKRSDECVVFDSWSGKSWVDRCQTRNGWLWVRGDGWVAMVVVAMVGGGDGNGSGGGGGDENGGRRRPI